jgi:hypothetical protein
MAATDTYYPQAYRCSSCKKESKHYNWSSEREGALHKCTCGHYISSADEIEQLTVQAPAIIIKMNMKQIKADRKKRSSAHHRREILPTLGKDEKRHFSKKDGKKYF